MHIPHGRTLCLMMLLCLASLTAAAEETVAPYDFSIAGAWQTAPAEVLTMMPEGTRSWSGAGDARLWCNKTHDGVHATPFSELASGAKASSAGLRWDRHAVFPTIACKSVPADWSAFPALSLTIDAQAATYEIVVIAALSDSSETAWRDFYYLPLQINWQGRKEITLPLSAFKSYEKPAGWNKITGLYLFTKAFGCQPNPYTDLTLSNLRLPAAAPATESWKECLGALPDERDADGFILRRNNAAWQTAQLNHTFPETADNQSVFAPYSHQHYFAAERSLFRYYPRFLPGYPCFAPDGKTYINAGSFIQWKGSDGKWQTSNVETVVANWAKAQGWKGMLYGWTLNNSEKAVRFDNDGDAYLMLHVERLNDQGQTYDWRTRTTLLLHSRDHLKTWTVYPLTGGRMACFEKLDGNNRDCLKRPPVILLNDYCYFTGSDPAYYLLLPEKKADGSLNIPQPVKIAENAMVTDQHSGGGNSAITCGDKVFIVFGWCVTMKSSPQTVKEMGGAEKANKQWTLTTLRKLPIAATLPAIPEDHPGLKQTLYNKNILQSGTSADGTPAFVVAYDLKTRTLSRPVFLGCGGMSMDDHNWPSITVDPKGYLHVLINGHHNPTNYTHSLKPYSIDGWTPPVYVNDTEQTPQEKRPHVSYATLNCDRAGNLYSIHRSTTGVYNNHLSVFRRDAATGQWAEETTLVTPFRYMYKVWGQKAMYDPAKDRLCLTFFSQSSMKQLTLDQYLFNIFIWPGQEKEYVKSSSIALPAPAANCAMVIGPASEITSLISQGPTGPWKLATSDDFQ